MIDLSQQMLLLERDRKELDLSYRKICREENKLKKVMKKINKIIQDMDPALQDQMMAEFREALELEPAQLKIIDIIQRDIRAEKNKRRH